MVSLKVNGEQLIGVCVWYVCVCGMCVCVVCMCVWHVWNMCNKYVENVCVGDNERKDSMSCPVEVCASSMKTSSCEELILDYPVTRTDPEHHDKGIVLRTKMANVVVSTLITCRKPPKSAITSQFGLVVLKYIFIN